MKKRLYLVSVIIAGFSFYLTLFPFHEVVPLKKAFSEFPLHWNGWIGRDHQFDPVILEKLRVNEYVMREYSKGAHTVTLYVGYYGTQREGAQIHSPKHCLPGGGWLLVSERTRDRGIEGGQRVRFVEAVYQKGDGKEVFIYWYRMKNADITNEYKLKGYMVFNSLKYRRNDAAFIRLSSPASGSVEETVATIEDFMRDFVPLLKEYLPG